MRMLWIAVLAALLATGAACSAECAGEHHEVEVNGVTLHYAVAGAGKPVVLLHGNGGSHEDLAVMIAQLAEAGYQVFAPDSRGQGANAPLEEYHYADMAEDTRQFIEAMGLEKPALYGWSDGGIIGLMLAAAHPEALALLAVSGANLDPAGANPELVAEFAEANERQPDPLVTLLLTEPHIEPAELARIEIPVLVTAGSEDLILPAHTRLIAESLPNAELRIIEGEDHQSYIMGSEKMGKMLIEFLQEHAY